MPATMLFAIVASLVAVAVLAVVLRPMWRSAPLATASVGTVALLACLGLYRLVGTPAGLDAAQAKPPATMDDAIGQLEAALARDPSQLEGWRLLGRAYASGQQWGKSRDAYARAAILAPDHPDVLVEAAESSALADPRRHFDGASVARLEHALKLQPRHQRARWFLGIAQRQAGTPAAAAATWEPLLAQVDARTAAPLREQVNVARAEAGLPPLKAPVPSSLRVRVQLDPAFASRVRLRGDASIFIIARVPDGPPMPVAVEKHAVGELPFTATLDDDDSPMPTQTLSALQEVEVLARLSSSGNAIRQPDDLESQPVRVRLPSDHVVTLTIGSDAR
jgi:cytochrome c-type biogenesis protein CcmH